ncbi:MAG: ABC transporter substrate-binding protein, partial [Acidobacteria bacterium]|nr:ABC transporter substrate-binding protein [Acidobacteriota bacterium]
GASMGDRYGPVVVARQPCQPEELRGKRIGIPGLMTSAYLTLKLFEPDFEPVAIPFDRIMDAVQEASVDAGLLIHEGQLTYGAGGLHKVIDLGEWWNETTGLPLPLGGNAIRRNLGEELVRRIAGIVKRSIEYSLRHKEEALRHAMQYARDLDPGQAARFVDMYVNERTLDYGPDGREAVRLLLRKAFEAGMIPAPVSPDFVEADR